MTTRDGRQGGQDRDATDDLEPHQKDVATPQTEDELSKALEDSFPASDPVNFAGSVAGRPAESEITEADPPVGTHPMAGATPDDEPPEDNGDEPADLRERADGR